MGDPFVLGFGGVRIRESLALTVLYEDWSGVRSPSRARRRMRYGHKQRVVHLQLPDPNAYQINGEIHMHPDTAAKFRALLSDEVSP